MTVADWVCAVLLFVGVPLAMWFDHRSKHRGHKTELLWDRKARVWRRWCECEVLNAAD